MIQFNKKVDRQLIDAWIKGADPFYRYDDYKKGSDCYRIESGFSRGLNYYYEFIKISKNGKFKRAYLLSADCDMDALGNNCPIALQQQIEKRLSRRGFEIINY